MLAHKSLATILCAILLCAALACRKEAPPPASEPTTSGEPLVKTPAPTTQTIVDRAFNLKTSVVFPFEVPAHMAEPHLHGIFQSFAGKAPAVSDDSANIDFAILNEAQHAAFAGDRPSEALFSVEDSHNQSVNFDLPPSMNEPVKYYLLFLNTQGNKNSKVVEADFHVDF
ncbi:MAG TPA: hypothetical protein VMG31_14030 [Verrucomicrobiae bacterium]|nr:hypothetical protein [Verrucomicrobiae bacterium]